MANLLGETCPETFVHPIVGHIEEGNPLVSEDDCQSAYRGLESVIAKGI